MNNNRIVQVNITPFPDLQRNFTGIDAAGQTHLFGEPLIDDDNSVIKRKDPIQEYYFHDWDEAHPSLDVYFSLVDHGDFD